MDQIKKLIGAKPANVLVPTILFIVLSPNFLVNLRTLKRPLLPTKLIDVTINALVFAVIYMLLRKQFKQFY